MNKIKLSRFDFEMFVCNCFPARRSNLKGEYRFSIEFEGKSGGKLV